MAKFRALMLWTDAWIADTQHLTRLERGTYHDLLVLMWRTPGCRVPNDDVWLAKHMRMSATEVANELRPLIKEFCRGDGNHIWQKRLRQERAWSESISEKQSGRAKSGWHTRRGLPQPISPTAPSNQLAENSKDVCHGNASVTVTKKDSGSPRGEPAANLFGEPDPPPPPLKANGPAAVQRPVSIEADVYRRGTEVLGAKSGGLVTALLKKNKRDPLTVMGILETAADTHDPREYVNRIIKGQRGEDLHSIVGY